MDAIFRTRFSCFIRQVLYTDYSPSLPPPLLSVIAFLRRSMRVIVESHINDVINSSVRRERDRPPVYICMYIYMLRRLRNDKPLPFNNRYEFRATSQLYLSIFSNFLYVSLLTFT